MRTPLVAGLFGLSMGGFIALCTSLVEAVLRGATLSSLLQESPALWVVWSLPLVLAYATSQIASHRAARERPVPWARPLPAPPIPVATLAAPAPALDAPVAPVLVVQEMPRPKTVIDDGLGGVGGDERLHGLTEQIRVLRDEAERDAGAARTRAQVFARFGPPLREHLTRLLAQFEPGEPSPAQEAAQALAVTVAHAVDLARLEAGQLTVGIEPVDLAPLLEEIRGWFGPIAAERRTGFHARIDPTARFVRSDPVAVRQVLAELLEHALRQTQGGQIQLVAERATPRRDAWIAVHVRDTGEGMDDGERARVFALDGPDAQQGEVGLAIARGLAEQLGGRIDVVSDKGVGSTFSLLLPPVAESEHAPARRSGVPLHERVRGLRVAVLHGGPAGAWLARELQAAGLAVRPADDASIVIADAEEPGAWTEIEDLVLAGRRVVLTVLRDEDARRGRSLGVRAVLFRPLDLRLALATLDRCADPLLEPVGAAG